MNPKPSLAQCLVLHDIADDGVWFDVTSGKWHSTYLSKDVTVQVDLLHRDGYIYISADPVPEVAITLSGVAVLDRRPLGELVERINSR
jgi:hypothetical protein